MKDARGRITRNLSIALLAGLGLMGLTIVATISFPFPNSRGFPLAYSSTSDARPATNPGGSGLSYDPLIVSLDYFFWVASAFAALSVGDAAWSRFAPPSGN
jgi:hypothetical protein